MQTKICYLLNGFRIGTLNERKTLPVASRLPREAFFMVWRIEVFACGEQI